MVMESIIDAYEQQTGDFPPLLLFEPGPESRIPGAMPKVPESPEHLVVIAVGQPIRSVVFEALDRVAKREPQPDANNKPKRLKFKDNTPLKSFFRQMAEMPATVFSITFPDDGPDAGTIFFLRTAFTISEFRREVQQPIE